MVSAPLTLTGLGKTCMQEWRQNENLRVTFRLQAYITRLPMGRLKLRREDRRQVGIVLFGTHELEAPTEEQLKMSNK